MHISNKSNYGGFFFRPLAEDSDEASVEEEPELQQGVLFILPHIISQDKAETFLSNVVAAGSVCV